MDVRQDESLSSSEPEGDRLWGTTHPERWEEIVLSNKETNVEFHPPPLPKV